VDNGGKNEAFFTGLLNKTRKDKIFIVILAGILMMVIAMPTKSSSAKSYTTLLKLVVMALLYQILGAVLEPVADSRIVKAVLVLSGSLENMIYMIAVTVVLMCLTMAIICFATNINLYV
jgi:hypothetical protein